VAYTEKRYWLLCRRQTTFICQASGCFCPICGYTKSHKGAPLLADKERVPNHFNLAKDLTD
jgi:hypothetical protein